MSKLQQLVRRFVEREIEYPEFHAAFVRDFLSIRHQDAAIEELVNIIEMSCADLDEGDIEVDDLRQELTVVATVPVVSIEMVSQHGVSKVNLPLSRVPLRRESGAGSAILLELQRAS